ncbi:hypothetical protein E2562_006770 [Oryza meyeriana var. granulata]|uniref:Uncharacterized protein n=2 Tax=Oryza meyeriana var. granulata TaxID=110450 RepID=A0A6G1C315_9ORYZ|nr:hypothetical protein E2562_006770 [Oryza meyeriana var. granulata]KAF0895055.1 hypothetical protein E2562_006770 [Oryza meyeriana var. granulata]
MENSSVTAKIWNFSVGNSDREKNLGWKRIGELLLIAARGNFAYSDDSLEIHYLCDKIKEGQLSGLHILQQSAFLTVREKFERVLSLWKFVSVNCKPELIHQLDKSKDTYTLTEFLDVSSSRSIRPLWIDRGRRTPALKTLRELLNEFRDIIEHEIEYISPEVITELTFKEIELGKKKSDLEHYIRKSWPVEFLMIQLWASNQTAELKVKELVGLKEKLKRKP